MKQRKRLVRIVLACGEGFLRGVSGGDKYIDKLKNENYTLQNSTRFF